MVDAEMCYFCGRPTGRAGASEDSIYISWQDVKMGPICEGCYDGIIAKISENFRIDGPDRPSGKYHIEKVPEGMKEPTLVDGERLDVFLWTLGFCDGCPIDCLGNLDYEEEDPTAEECRKLQLAYLRREEESDG